MSIPVASTAIEELGNVEKSDSKKMDSSIVLNDGIEEDKKLDVDKNVNQEKNVKDFMAEKEISSETLNVISQTDDKLVSQPNPDPEVEDIKRLNEESNLNGIENINETNDTKENDPPDSQKVMDVEEKEFDSNKCVEDISIEDLSEILAEQNISIEEEEIEEEEDIEKEPEEIEEIEDEAEKYEESEEAEDEEEYKEQESAENAIVIDSDDDEEEKNDEDDDDEVDEVDEEMEEDDDEEEAEDEEVDDEEVIEEDNVDDAMEENVEEEDIGDEDGSEENDENENEDDSEDLKEEDDVIEISAHKQQNKLGIHRKKRSNALATKLKNPYSYLSYLKKRSIKLLSKRMQVMGADETIFTISTEPDSKTDSSKLKSDYTKDDEGIEIIEDEATEVILNKITEGSKIKSFEKVLNDSLTKTAKPICTLSTTATITNFTISNVVSLITPPKLKNESEVETENKNCDNNISSKPKTEKSLKLVEDDIEMIGDNQAVDLSQEKLNQTESPKESKPEDSKEKEKLIKNENNCEKRKDENKKNSDQIKTSQNILEPLSKSDQNQKLVNVLPSQNLLTDNDKIENKSDINLNDDKGLKKEEYKKIVDSGSTTTNKKILTQSGAIKRSSSPSNNQSLDYSNPSKKHCDDANRNFNSQQQNQLVNEFMEKSTNDTPDELKKHINQIEEEINQLDNMLKVKEEEWNNVLHLKKIKEEVLERLTRRKRIIDIKSILSINNSENIHHTLNANNNTNNNKSMNNEKPLTNTIVNTVNLKDGGPTNLTKYLTCNNLITSLSSSTPTSNSVGMASTTQIILQNRANMKTADLAKEKLNTQRLQRNILPKSPTSNFMPFTNNSCNNQNKILNYTSTNLNQQKKLTIHHQQQQQQQQSLQRQTNDYLNGHQNSSAAAMGRQGAIKDVQSIIADYRQKHPEQVPRRGRRLRPSFSIHDLSGEGGPDNTSRPSSADSSHSNSNVSTPNTNQQQNSTNISNNNTSNVSFKDVLVKFAKMTPTERQRLNAGNSATLLSTLNLTNTTKPPTSYPEVTLHPLNAGTSSSSTIHSEQNQNLTHSNSLLHGILTKNSSRPSNVYNSFSPTLARLLTAPERINPQAGGNYTHSNLTAAGVNLTKNHNEITITPVLNSNNQTVYQKREESGSNRIKSETNFNMDDEADDSVDRLVIDEGDSPNDNHNNNMTMAGTLQEFNENEVPECQGCKKREAQFVCAGCGNQWYCSRECQVHAWDEHSEICTG